MTERLLLRNSLPKSAITLATVLIVLTGGYGLCRMRYLDQEISSKDHLSVAIVQPNIGNISKLSSQLGYEDAVERIRENFAKQIRSISKETLDQDGKPGLIVLPETTVPGYFMTDSEARSHMFQLAHEMGAYIFFGGYHAEGNKTFNTAYLISPNYQVMGLYDKIYLLAFGEYLPLSRYFPSVQNLFPAIGNFATGKRFKALPMEKWKLTPLICYEAILPRLVRKIAKSGSNLIVNITNDSWFGNTAEPYQHLSLTIFRAIEHRKALVRATNTGVSAFIDPLGRITAQTKTFQPAILQSEVPYMEEATWFMKYGDVFFIFFSILSISAILGTLRRD